MRKNQKTKAHIFDNEISKTLCGADSNWMEAGGSFTTDGKTVEYEFDGKIFVDHLTFEDYINCKNCKKTFKKKFLS